MTQGLFRLTPLYFYFLFGKSFIQVRGHSNRTGAALPHIHTQQIKHVSALAHVILQT